MKVRVFWGFTSAFDPNRAFQLAGRAVDPQLRQVVWNESMQSLEPKLIALLLVLIEAGGRPVSRAELVEKIWNGAVVSDDAVQRTIWKLRRALDDDTRDPSIIGTIPKSGYRLLAEPRQKQYVHMPNWSVAASLAVIMASVGWLALHSTMAPNAPEFDFTSAKAITSSPGFELAPALAPTGNLLAYVAYNDDQPDPSLDLMMLDRSTGKTETLADGPGMQAWPEWSRDGQSLLYVDGTREFCEIILMSIVDRSERVVAPCIRAFGVQLAWGGDRNTAYVIDAVASGGAKSLTKLNLVSGAREVIPIDVSDVKEIALSPSGRQLAIIRERLPELHDIYLIDLQSRSQRRITNESHFVQGLDWSSDERALIVSSDRAGLFRLWKLNIDNGHMAAIAAPGMNASSPETGSEAGPLIYQVWNNEINLQLIGDGQQSDYRIARSNRWEWSPSPSPDGKQIAFLTNRDGSTDLWVAAADGSSDRRVASFATSFDTVLSWAPDGSAIALSALKGDYFSLALVDAATGDLSWIEHPRVNLRDPFFSPDGARLYYASDEEGEWMIRAKTIGNEERDQIIAAGLLARPSRDGSVIYIATGEGALDRLDLKSGARRRIVSGRRSGYSRAWTPTRKGIAFLEGEFSAGYRIMAWNQAADEISLLKEIEGDVLESSALAEGFDGGIWIARMDYCASDLWEAPLSH